MKKLIKITKDHIRYGTANQPRSCPIAIALACTDDALVDSTDISVGAGNVYVTRPDSSSVIGLPRSAKRFIAKFDSGKRVKPFNFYLDV